MIDMYYVNYEMVDYIVNVEYVYVHVVAVVVLLIAFLVYDI